jgi:hypothetical protein
VSFGPADAYGNQNPAQSQVYEQIYNLQQVNQDLRQALEDQKQEHMKEIH